MTVLVREAPAVPVVRASVRVAPAPELALGLGLGLAPVGRVVLAV